MTSHIAQAIWFDTYIVKWNGSIRIRCALNFAMIIDLIFNNPPEYLYHKTAQDLVLLNVHIDIQTAELVSASMYHM